MSCTAVSAICCELIPSDATLSKLAARDTDKIEEIKSSLCSDLNPISAFGCMPNAAGVSVFIPSATWSSTFSYDVDVAGARNA